MGREQLDRAARALAAHKAEFARAPVSIKLALLRQCAAQVAATASEWVAEGLRARRLSPRAAGEEWMAGPLPLMRTVRLLCESLEHIARYGRPPLGTGAVKREDGRFRVDVFPSSGVDKVLFGGFAGWALMEPGADRSDTRRAQAAFYQGEPSSGGVSLVLGADGAAVAPLLEALSRLFVHGHVCLLKLGRSSGWLEPLAARLLAPLVDAGYLRIVCGDDDVGRYLAAHEGIDHIHLTGRPATYDALLWGTDPAERERRRAGGAPRVTVPVTAQLWSITPIAIVPHAYRDDELEFQARSIASMVACGVTGYRCAPGVLVTARGWAQRERFLELVGAALADIPPRVSHRRGARARRDALVSGRADVRVHGEASGDALPWTLLVGVDPGRGDDPLYAGDPIAPVLGEVCLDRAGPAQFLDAAAAFMTDRLPGTLAAGIVIADEHEQDRRVSAALERTLVNLRYGVVAINHWPALAYVAGTLPWGGHPSSTPRDIRSGVGWSRNTFMLGGVEKAVLRGPLMMHKPPVWFADNPKGGALAERMMKLEAPPPPGASAVKPDA